MSIIIALDIALAVSVLIIVHLAVENYTLRKHLTKFDHDHDGKPGGSRPKKRAY